MINAIFGRGVGWENQNINPRIELIYLLFGDFKLIGIATDKSNLRSICCSKC
jgi:hypothetical protein